MSNISPQPPLLNYATPLPADRIDLRQIAVRQRYIQLCILIYFALVAAFVMAPLEFRVGVRAAMFATIITAAVFCFFLAIAVYGVAKGIIMGIVSLVPYIGLISLLVVNMKATRILRRHGITVGLFGASANQIPDRGNTPA